MKLVWIPGKIGLHPEVPEAPKDTSPDWAMASAGQWMKRADAMRGWSRSEFQADLAQLLADVDAEAKILERQRCLKICDTADYAYMFANGGYAIKHIRQRISDAR